MSITYSFADPENHGIVRLDGSESRLWIPVNPKNRDYQEYLEGVSEGLWPEASSYVEPTAVDLTTDLTEAKTIASSDVRLNAYPLLQPTDWVVVRAAETGVEAPADITSFRESVRTASASKIATIESKTDLESLKAYLRSDEYKNWPEQ